MDRNVANMACGMRPACALLQALRPVRGHGGWGSPKRGGPDQQRAARIR